ncbi:bromodomain testis-specific protein-like [Parambassis ranga]|uniref:Bromodomain-containing protein 2 n=1 Tax=Parambassis ranga TaxID=210632 RepID=A0A6P7JRB5_9TELE|nr:bromodomain testis-specific protein-like [Parambassis ranga]
MECPFNQRSLMSEGVLQQTVTVIPPDVPQLNPPVELSGPTDSTIKTSLKREAYPETNTTSRELSPAQVRSPAQELSTAQERSPAQELSVPCTLVSQRKSGRQIKPPKKDFPAFEDKKVRLSKELRSCNDILKELLSKRHQAYSWPFRTPVDAVAMNLHDYHDIIKQPMDLSTIRKKLDKGEYANAKEFAADVRLMFSNCYRYNPPSHEVAYSARKLQEIFEARYMKLSLEPEGRSVSRQQVVKGKGSAYGRLSTSASSESESSSEGESTSEGVKMQLADLEKQLKVVHDQLKKFTQESLMKSKKKEKLKKRKRLQGRYLAQLKYEYFILSSVQIVLIMLQGQHSNKAHIKCVDDDVPSKSVTYEEMNQLKLDISKLPGDKMGKVVKIIHTSESSTQDSIPEIIEVDFETLKTSTLRALQRFVAACLGKVNTKGGKEKQENPSGGMQAGKLHSAGKSQVVSKRQHLIKKKKPRAKVLPSTEPSRPPCLSDCSSTSSSSSSSRSCGSDSSSESA